MKKILILPALGLAVLSAQAATETTYWAGNTGDNLLKIDTGYNNMPYLSNETTTSRLPASALTTLTTQDDTTYRLVFKNEADVNFSINQAAYFHSVTVSGAAPSSITINFGKQGSITTAEEFNIGKSSPTATLTLSADFTDEMMSSLIADTKALTQSVYSRDLIVAKGNHGFWNVKECYEDGTMSFTSAALDAAGLLNIGIVDSADKIQYGQYGLVFTELDSALPLPEKLTLVAKTPEPATATLSLLALAGLAARRRRH